MESKAQKLVKMLEQREELRDKIIEMAIDMKRDEGESNYGLANEAKRHMFNCLEEYREHCYDLSEHEWVDEIDD